MITQFLTGLTYSLLFNFRDELGVRTSVSSPVVNFYTPQKELYYNQASLTTTSVIGQYQFDFFAPVGLTVGHWNALGVGLSHGTTLFSERQVFEVFDIHKEAFWCGLEELRGFLNLEDDDRTNDKNLQQALRAAIELVEAYCHRSFGEDQIDEIIEIVSTDRVQLKRFPVNSIVGITATVKTIPRGIGNIVIETLTGAQVGFYYRLDGPNGILHLLDSAGYDLERDGLLLCITYRTGFVSVPEPVRQATLSIAAQLNALACNEGVESVKFSDMQFVRDRRIFSGHTEELLRYYRNNFKI